MSRLKELKRYLIDWQLHLQTYLEMIPRIEAGIEHLYGIKKDDYDEVRKAREEGQSESMIELRLDFYKSTVDCIRVKREELANYREAVTTARKTIAFLELDIEEEKERLEAEKPAVQPQVMPDPVQGLMEDAEIPRLPDSDEDFWERAIA